MFFVVRSNDSFNFPLGLIMYIVIIVPFYICLVNLRFLVKKASNMAKSGDIFFTKVCLLYEILSLIMLLSRNSDKHIWRLKNRSLNIGSCS